MAKASRQQTRQIGNLSLLVPAPRPPASGLGSCLRELEQRWQQGGHLAALWRAWPRIAGAQLAPHCRPLRLHSGLLTVGAAPAPGCRPCNTTATSCWEPCAPRASRCATCAWSSTTPVPPLRRAACRKRRCGPPTPAGWTCMAWPPAPAAPVRRRPARWPAGATAASAANGTWAQPQPPDTHKRQLHKEQIRISSAPAWAPPRWRPHPDDAGLRRAAPGWSAPAARGRRGRGHRGAGG